MNRNFITLPASVLGIITASALIGNTASAQSSSGWVKVQDESAIYRQPVIKSEIQFKPNPPVAKRGFVIRCKATHLRRVDPIVAPGVARTHHLHQFIGNPNVDQNSTTQSLLDTPSSEIACDNKNDKSAYWLPAVYQDGKLVQPHKTNIYYRSRQPNTVPMPLGLRMIAGDASAKRNAPGKNIQWRTDKISTGNSQTMVTAKGNSDLKLRIRFPNCWDGKHLDSPDHKSHVVYPISTSADGYQVCPKSHPVRIPMLSTFTNYKAKGGSKLTLSSGEWFTAHQDFWNAMAPDHFNALHSACSLKKRQCAIARGGLNTIIVGR